MNQCLRIIVAAFLCTCTGVLLQEVHATDLTFGTISIPEAGKLYKPGESLACRFEVKNINILPAASYSCTAKITPKSGGSQVYLSTQTGSNLQPGATAVITMPEPWTTTTGNYNLELKIFFSEDINTTNNTVTIDLTVAQCCLSGSEWHKGPSMNIIKNLSSFPAGEQLQRMRPGDLIALSAYITDADILVQKCLCITGTDTAVSQTPYGPYADNVSYVWSIQGPGKLIEPDGNERSSVLYELPLCDTNPVRIECRVRNDASTTKMRDEELLATAVIHFTVGARLPDDPGSSNDIGNARFLGVELQITPFVKPSDEIIETVNKSQCTPQPPQWLEKSPLAGGFDIRQKTSTVTCPDYAVLLFAERNDLDSMITSCNAFESQPCPVAENPKGSLQSDAVHYTWKIKSGKGLFPLGNEGACVVFVRSKSENAVIECEITDSKTQFKDVQTVQLSANAVRQRSPRAYVGVGNIAYEKFWINWGDYAQLLDAALQAKTWYETVGYEVEFESYATRASAAKILENPCYQAFWIVGHGASESGRAGVIEMSDDRDFTPNNITTASNRAFNCPKHPFVREAVLMGCYSGRGSWGSRFFSARVYGFQGALINARWLIHEVLNWEKDKHFPPIPHDLRVP
ncbi:MAG: hypothetical protein U0264_10625 [Candidatus Kapaibacterium sp.]